jgi:hypothetical protein
MSGTKQAEILLASLKPNVYESGGDYGQTGVDFQRYWALSRIIELVGGQADDFLVLFETFQDVAEFNHSQDPSHVRVYQLKMKSTGDWKWKTLTELPKSSRKKANSNEHTTPKEFTESPIGKLALVLAELDSVKSEGIFVSNLGSEAELAIGGQAGTLRFCKFSELSQELQEQIKPELLKLKRPISLDSLSLHKTELSVDDVDTHTRGKMYDLLLQSAPSHVGQSKSFCASLFAILSARGRKKDPPNDFAELARIRGYSKNDFEKDLEELRSVPDTQAVLESWLDQLKMEGMPIFEQTQLQVKVTQLFERRLRMGVLFSQTTHDSITDWVKANPPGTNLCSFLTAGMTALSQLGTPLTRVDIKAALLLEGIDQCLNQI